MNTCLFWKILFHCVLVSVVVKILQSAWSFVNNTYSPSPFCLWCSAAVFPWCLLSMDFFLLTHRLTFFSICILGYLVFITSGEFSAIIFMNIAFFLFSTFTPSRTLIRCLLALVQSPRAPRYTCFHEHFLFCSLCCTLDSFFRSVFLFFLFWESSVSSAYLSGIFR